MRAAVLYEAKTPMVFEDLTLGDPRRGEVRVKIGATGICHSDYHVIDGSWHGSAFPLPTVLGHEAAGIVEEIGTGVTLTRPGDHVILSFVASCGRCRYCVGGSRTSATV
jgi:S-(hydroxymethyl)glutathione dehydrogenase/alcohol dehydrogenase